MGPANQDGSSKGKEAQGRRQTTRPVGSGGGVSGGIGGGVGEVRLGFIALTDACPLLAAADLGYFADEGLRVVLERQLGWGNVRDKIISGHLDGSHALLGLPLAGAMGPKGLDRMVAIMSLGTGGPAITLSRSLATAGVVDSAGLSRWMGRRKNGSGARGFGRPVFGHVFPASVHHYLLRRWLADGDVDPDRDVDLCVLPPPQVAAQMERGHLSGFCVSEPWNTLAQMKGFGRVTVLGTDMVADHPDKVLAVRRDWLEANSETAVRLTRAIIRGALFCNAPANRSKLVEILARPDRINVSGDVMEASLKLDIQSGTRRFRSTSLAAIKPSRQAAMWLLGEMRRWGHTGALVDHRAAAIRAVRTESFQRAVADLGMEMPRAEVGAEGESEGRGGAAGKAGAKSTLAVSA